MKKLIIPAIIAGFTFGIAQADNLNFDNRTGTERNPESLRYRTAEEDRMIKKDRREAIRERNYGTYSTTTRPNTGSEDGSTLDQKTNRPINNQY